MAAKFFMSGGVDSNWSSDTNWSTTASTGPNNTTHAVDGDTVTINASSPACIVDVASACTSVTFAGYTNTLTMTSTLTAKGNVTLASGMTISGTGNLILDAAATVAANGKTWPGGVELKGVNGTQFTLGTLTITGILLISTPGASGAKINSSTVTIAGGFTCTGACGNTSISTLTLTGGTWSGTGAVSNHLTLAGNVTISGTVHFSGGTLTYSSGTITVTSSTLVIDAASTTLNLSTCHLNNFTGPGGTTTVTLSSALNIDGTMTQSGSCTYAGAFTITCGAYVSSSNTTFGGALVCTGNISLSSNCTPFSGGFSVTGASATLTAATIAIGSSNVTISGTTTIASASVINGAFNWTTGGLTTTGNLTGTSTIVFGGTGTWTGAAGSLANATTINTAGTLTISGTVLYTTSTLTYTTGTVTVTSSTLSVASGTLTTASMSWNNVTFTGTAVTLGSALNVLGTMTFPNSALTFSGSFNITCGTLSHTGITATRIVTFVAGVTITVTSSFVASHSAAQTVRFTYKTSSGGSTASFILGPGATQDVGLLDPTDLNASSGQTILSYHGVVSNSQNWTATIPPVRRSAQMQVGF